MEILTALSSITILFSRYANTWKVALIGTLTVVDIFKPYTRDAIFLKIAAVDVLHYDVLDIALKSIKSSDIILLSCGNNAVYNRHDLFGNWHMLI